MFAFVSFAAHASPNESPIDFDRAFPSAYEDLRVDGKLAYDGKRYDEAFPLLMKTACAGDKESQWLIGNMYLRGQGVVRDDLRGYGWMKAAAEFQWASYRSMVDKLEKAMTEEQRKIAASEADTIIAAYGLRATNISCGRAASRGGHIMDTIKCTPQIDGSMLLLKRCEGAPVSLIDRP